MPNETRSSSEFNRLEISQKLAEVFSEKENVSEEEIASIKQRLSPEDGVTFDSLTPEEKLYIYLLDKCNLTDDELNFIVNHTMPALDAHDLNNHAFAYRALRPRLKPQTAS